jgi:methionyl-tRNA synthetase
MITIATNDNNDIYLDSIGNLVLSEGKEAVAQVCRNEILTIKGELKYDTDKGIPYWDILSTGRADLDTLRFYILKTVQKIDEVQTIKSLNFETNNDEIRYTLNIETQNGEAVING